MAVPNAKGAYRPRCFFDLEINGSPGKSTTRFGYKIIWNSFSIKLFYFKTENIG